MATDADWTLRLEPGQPIPEAVARKLEGMIESGGLPRGDSLPNENELARRLKVSRSSVRTALQALQHRGLVDVSRGRGWTATRTAPVAEPPVTVTSRAGVILGPVDASTASANPDAYELSLLFEVRQSLESAASALAAVKATPADLQAIERAHEAHRAADTRDVETVLATDEAFHAAIFRAAGSSVLTDAYRLLVPRVRDFRLSCFDHEVAQSVEYSSIGHGLVLEFLRNHDAGGARQAMASHLLMFSSRLAQAMPTITAGI